MSIIVLKNNQNVLKQGIGGEKPPPYSLPTNKNIKGEKLCKNLAMIKANPTT